MNEILRILLIISQFAFSFMVCFIAVYAMAEDIRTGSLPGFPPQCPCPNCGRKTFVSYVCTNCNTRVTEE